MPAKSAHSAQCRVVRASSAPPISQALRLILRCMSVRAVLRLSNGAGCSLVTTHRAGVYSSKRSRRPCRRACSGTRRRSIAPSGRGNSSGSTAGRSIPPRRKETRCCTRSTSRRSTRAGGCCKRGTLGECGPVQPSSVQRQSRAYNGMGQCGGAACRRTAGSIT